jgi:hypothetical protein
MKNIKLVVFVGVIPVAVAAGFLLVNRQTARNDTHAIVELNRETVQIENAGLPAAEAASDATTVTSSRGIEATAALPSVSDLPEMRAEPKRKLAKPSRQSKAATATKTPAVSPPFPSARPPKEPIQDPIAREALYFVGTDLRAEEYWYEAINDPSLSAHEREDLIEDLNEVGLPDPKNPTVDDLPLIVRRLQLIEAVGPDPMDEVNADAFMEAYKDLVNLAEIAMGGGEPVR